MKSKGFTLIELLVVISLIGILAVAVLSALNPIEQLNKGRDAGRRADASQLVNAIDRYYASNEEFPWNKSTLTNYVTSVDGAFKELASFVGIGVCGGTNATANGAGATGCSSPGLLISSSELKSQFTKRKAFRSSPLKEDVFKVAKEANDPSVSVCFVPSSKATRDNWTKLKKVDFDVSPSITACPATPVPTWESFATSCFVCIPEE